MQKVNHLCVSFSDVHWLTWALLSLQQEDQPQSSEEESSEESEDNAQTEPLRQDGKTSCHPAARPCCK